MEDLRASASIDISKLQAGLANAQKDLAATAIAANKLDSSLKKATPGANRAGQALTDLGRVAQDAQFGFIGIANNLNPMLDSFQRLQKESGGTRGALKALAGSLMGAGGIGFALSLAIPIIGFITDGFGAWTRGMKGNKAALDENAKAAKAAAEAYNSILGTLAEESNKVSILVTQLKDENISRKQRAEAIKQLQQLSPEYFSTLNTEKSTLADITVAYNKYAASITRAIEARVREKDLTDITTKILELEKKGLDVGSKQIVIDGKLVNVQRSRIADADELNSTLSEYQRLQRGSLGLTKQELDQLANLKLTREKLIELVAKGKGLESLNVPDKAKKDAETIADVVKKVRHQIDDVNNKNADLFGVSVAKENIGVLTTAITHLLDKFKGVAGQEAAIINFKAQIDDITLKESLKGTVAAIETAALAKPIEMPLTITAPSGKNLKKALEPINKEMTSLLQDTTLGLAVGLGEAIGKAFAGGGNFLKDSLGSVFTIMGDFLINLGKAAVATSKLFLAIKASKSNPITGIVGGIAAIAAGFVLKNIKLPGFATGGFVSGPGTRTSDSVFARLSKGEYVINADTVSRFGTSFFDMLNKGRLPGLAGGGQVGGSIGGGQSLNLTGEFEIRGDRLVAVVARAQSRINRNG